jgi:hypothetical protein
VHDCSESGQILVWVCGGTDAPDVVVGVTVIEVEFVPVVTVKACVTGVATRSIVVAWPGVIVVVVAGCSYPALDKIPIAYWLEVDRGFVTSDGIIK